MATQACSTLPSSLISNVVGVAVAYNSRAIRYRSGNAVFVLK
ncbi:MAG TPA: hypothetical protein VJT69_09260 [Pyrinomonadaceae bacterium]|nr:hypothetical protein [Pyrinomonadaceae bacterium]